MSVGEYCNREVVIVSRDATIREAARLMREYHVGDLVVVAEGEKGAMPVGILTDRDIVVELVAQGVDPGTVVIGDVMTFDLHVAREENDILDTIRYMRDQGVRRLPVIDRDEKLVGILSVDDIIELIDEQLAQVVQLISREQRLERQTR